MATDMSRDDFFDWLDEHREAVLDEMRATEDAEMSPTSWLNKLYSGLKPLARTAVHVEPGGHLDDDAEDEDVEPLVEDEDEEEA